MIFGMDVWQTKEKSVSRSASKIFLVWRQNDLMCMNFASASTQPFLIGLRNFHTKIHAFSTICEIFTPLTPTSEGWLFYIA